MNDAQLARTKEDPGHAHFMVEVRRAGEAWLAIGRPHADYLEARHTACALVREHGEWEARVRTRLMFGSYRVLFVIEQLDVWGGDPEIVEWEAVLRKAG